MTADRDAMKPSSTRSIYKVRSDWCRLGSHARCNGLAIRRGAYAATDCACDCHSRYVEAK